MSVRHRERIAKLLALARDQEGRPEGATALKLARSLAQRHGITDLSMPAPEGEPQATVPLGGDPAERYREDYRAALLRVLANLAGCDAGYHAATWEGRIYGHPGVAAEVAQTYRHLAAHLDKWGQRAFLRDRMGQRTPQKHSYKRTWWAAIAIWIHHNEDWDQNWGATWLHLHPEWLIQWGVLSMTLGNEALRKLPLELKAEIAHLSKRREGDWEGLDPDIRPREPLALPTLPGP